MPTINYYDENKGDYVEIDVGGGGENEIAISDSEPTGGDRPKIWVNPKGVPSSGGGKITPVALYSGTDLNDIIEPGWYYSYGTIDAQGIENSPTNISFSMEVIPTSRIIDDVPVSLLQRVTEHYIGIQGRIFERHIYNIPNAGFGDWFQIYTSANPSYELGVSRPKSPDIIDANDYPEKNRASIRETDPSYTLNNPNPYWFHILSIQGEDFNYATQLALGMTANELYYRNKKVHEWSKWFKILTELEYGTADISSIADGTLTGIINYIVNRSSTFRFIRIKGIIDNNSAFIPAGSGVYMLIVRTYESNSKSARSSRFYIVGLDVEEKTVGYNQVSTVTDGSDLSNLISSIDAEGVGFRINFTGRYSLLIEIMDISVN